MKHNVSVLILRVIVSHGKPTETILNNRIKDYALADIRDGLSELLMKGVIAVTDKRFWVRDKTACMEILNGQTDLS